ncbi:MAG: hypothetical protein ABMA13_20090 [Chthoniobacteraceae bacterium]
MNRRTSFITFAAALCLTLLGVGVAIDYNTQVRPTTNGYHIGDAADQAIGFWGATPVIQQTIGAITDNSGGATADGTIAIVTAPTALTDNGGGTADATVASMAAAVTLTDSTGLSGTHDDTLAATTTQADLTGGEDPTEAEFNTLLAEVRVIAQNESDLAQKVIEIVTRQTTEQDNFKELTTAQAANRAAIVALTDAVKELSTQVNLVRTKFITNGLLAAP